MKEYKKFVENSNLMKIKENLKM